MKMLNVVITGASSGLGRAMAIKFADEGHFVWNLDCVAPESELGHEQWVECYVQFEESVRMALQNIPVIDVLINNAGINHIAWLEKETSANFDHLIGVNAKSIFITAKECLEKLTTSKGTILNIVSNASHMPMTTSLAYNASKGAAHIMTQQLARELTKKNGITVFGISPAKIEGTGMSDYIDKTVPAMRGWSEEKAHEYQLNGLVAGKEIPAEAIANFVYYLLHKRENNFHLSGNILPYGA